MARRNFIKAYNDMVSGSGQVSGVNVPELASNGPFPREVDTMSRQSVMNMPTKDKSYPSRYVVNQPKSIYKPSPIRNVQNDGGWGGIKPKDRNVFVDIDGEPFAEEVNSEAIEVVDTSHKIQRHISLVDLARPYVPRAPNNKAREMHENRQTEKMTNNEAYTITSALPKGFSDSDRPYVLPKFTPTFKEMISTKSKKDTLVSLTEPTPPSMQKWAIEWNSEPKHSISIAELKEDIIREKSERNIPGNEKTKDIIFAEEGTPFDDEAPQIKQQPIVPKLKEKTPNTMTPRDNAHYYSNRSDFESDFTFFEPSKYEQDSKQQEAQRPVLLNKKTALDWLPEKYEGMKRIFKGIPKEKYSFKQAIQEKMMDGMQQQEPVKKVSRLSGTSDREVSFDEDRRQFHQWFRNRLSRRGEKDESTNSRENPFFGIEESSENSFYATGRDPYTTPITYSEGDPTKSPPKENPSLNSKKSTELDRQARISSNMPDYVPPKEEVKETVDEQHPSEKNSSFCYWLKQRGLINLTKNKTSERSKPPRTDDVVIPEPKFPWSTSYMCKYIPGGSSIKKDRNDPNNISKPARTNPYREEIPLRKAVTQTFPKKRTLRKKVKSHGALRKSETKKSDSIKEKSKYKKNRQNADENNGRNNMQSGRTPYHGWIVDNELDHVKNLRLMENFHVAPQIMNRKKLFPSLHEHRSTPPVNNWESKFAKPLTRTKDDEFYSKEKGTMLSGTTAFGDTPGISKSTIEPAKLPDLFVDHKDFIDISEDPISSLKSLLNDPKDPTGFTSSSRAVDEDIKISRCAVKLSRKIGKNLTGGNPTVIAKLTEASKAPKKDSPLRLQLARNTDYKTQEGCGLFLETQDSSDKLKQECSIRGLEAERNEMDENWLKIINPKQFNFDCDADLIQHLKKGSSECKSSFAIDKQT